MATVALRGVRKSFGTLEVVHGVDLDVADREFVVLVGPSGCGKSTILRMIAGLEEISAGTIAIDGRTVNELDPKDRDIAMVFQDYALYPHMNVFENMAFSLRYRGVGRDEIKRRVEEAARILEIETLTARMPRQLSGGQRQRVPVTTVYVTHDQVEAMTLADRIVILNGGRIEQIGTPEEVYDTPATVFVAAFIGAPPMNLVPARLAGEGRIEIVGGRAVALDAPTARRAGDASARDVLAGFRPEHLTWAGDDSRAAIVGEAVVVEPLGSDTMVSVDVAGASVIARLPPRVVRRAGERVALAVDPAHVHVFDRASERRL